MRDALVLLFVGHDHEAGRAGHDGTLLGGLVGRVIAAPNEEVASVGAIGAGSVRFALGDLADPAQLRALKLQLGDMAPKAAPQGSSASGGARPLPLLHHSQTVGVHQALATSVLGHQGDG